MRHTNISHLIAEGISVKEVSTRVGHAHVSTTTNIYTHSMKIAEAKTAIAAGHLLLPLDTAEITKLKEKNAVM